MTTSNPDFRELILMNKRGDSYPEISKRAGGNPKSRAIQSLVVDGFTRMPSPETITGLAKALNINAGDLVLAAARTLGMDVRARNDSDLVLYGAGRLPEESQDLLRNTAAELLNWMDGSRSAEEPLPEVTKLPKRKQPDYLKLAADTEDKSEGKESSAHMDALGEESQEH